MTYEEISCERKEGLTEIQIQRPDHYNTFTPITTEEIKDALSEHGKDKDTRAILIMGAGDSFSAGADVKSSFEMSVMKEAGIQEIFEEGIGHYHSAIAEIQSMPKPVIAGVNGPAAGAGFSLAVACDVTFVSDDAFLKYAYTDIGLTGDGGITFFLPRLVGVKNALDIVLRSSKIRAQEAVDLGLANEVLPSEGFKEEVRERSRELAGGPTAALGWVKQMVRDSFETSLDVRLEEELETFCDALETEDFEEGVRAFLEKEEPEFQGK